MPGGIAGRLRIGPYVAPPVAGLQRAGDHGGSPLGRANAPEVGKPSYGAQALLQPVTGNVAPKCLTTGARERGCVSAWRPRPDSNRGMEVLQTSALPLGYAASAAPF